MLEPKKSHENAVKYVSHYLKGTLDKGPILAPSDNLTIGCYPNADLAQLWGHEHPQDPHYVHSLMGYIITLAGCTVVWVSKLETKIELLTMEAKYVTFKHSVS
ncbi:hypothetical protein ACHAWF_009913 [Thalassiosira exigua]